VTSEMHRPQIDHMGLRFFLGDEESPDEFGHDGGDEGFQADLVMFVILARESRSWAILT
jgi:hypothetical protein